ncbi:MAG: hypothetical protein LKKZDAJK_000800 [Candidatus Fervidibacter sp.]
MASEEQLEVKQSDFPAPLISIIIPAHNEADRIAQTIAALRRAAERSGWAWELIVVDDASEDDTATVAAQAGATKVFRLSRPFGKGAALRRGIAEAKGDIVLFADADIGDDAEKFWTLVECVRRGDADMVIAAPPPDPKGGGFGIVKTFSAWAIRKATGFQPQAPLSGQRALRRTVLERLQIADGYAVETALTIDALRAHFRVVEVPIPFGHRALGKSWQGFLHRAKQLWDIAKAVLPRLLSK